MLSNEELLTRQLVQCTKAMQRVINELQDLKRQAGAESVALGARSLEALSMDLAVARSEAVDVDGPAFDECSATNRIDELEERLRKTEDALGVMTRAHQELTSSIQQRIAEGTEAQKNGYENRIKELQEKVQNLTSLTVNKDLEVEAREFGRENEALRSRLSRLEESYNKLNNEACAASQAARTNGDRALKAESLLRGLRKAVQDLLQP